MLVCLLHILHISLSSFLKISAEKLFEKICRNMKNQMNIVLIAIIIMYVGLTSLSPFFQFETLNDLTTHLHLLLLLLLLLILLAILFPLLRRLPLFTNPSTSSHQQVITAQTPTDIQPPPPPLSHILDVREEELADIAKDSDDRVDQKKEWDRQGGLAGMGKGKDLSAELELREKGKRGFVS